VQRAQKKMLDVLNSVGMGESVLRMIERRHKADVYIALGGMVSAQCICASCLKQWGLLLHVCGKAWFAGKEMSHAMRMLRSFAQ
jgi:Golgi SNAP receptor complex protein 2